MENIEKGNRSSIKPKVCIEYKKKHMGGVDLLDQVTSYNSCTRKGIKKYYKIFFRLLEITLHNSYIIYKRNEGTKSFLDYKLELIEKLVSAYANDVY